MLFIINFVSYLLGRFYLLSFFQTRAVDFLGRCQNPDGGFAGGPGQLSHLAPTYAAVNALMILGTKEAYEVINRWVHLILSQCFSACEMKLNSS